jgi:Tol biopolymer transport system component
MNKWMWRSIGAGLTSSLLASSAVAFAGPVRFGGEGHAETPVWSLDGNHIAFEVNRLSGDIEMFLAKVTGDVAADARALKLPGGGASAYGSSGTVVTSATFHPQGFVVFEASNQGGDYRLFYGSVGGGSPQEFLKTSELSGKLTFPSVSADGSQMAFIASATGAGDIYVRASNNGAVTQHTKTPETESSPLLSADGKRIVYSKKNNGTEDLYELVIASEAVTAVASGGGDQTRPTYAAGGAIVYFDGARGEDLWDLAMVPSVGAKPQTLARDVRLPTRARPAVSPDGKWVAFAHSDPARDDKIYVTSLDGETVKEIATGMKAAGDPAITVKEGRTLLAFTALPAAEAGWRTLVVLDITSKL